MSKILKTFLLFILASSPDGYAFGQKSWKENTSVEDLCESYPEVIRHMFDAFNLGYQGMEKVRAAVTNGDITGACHHLLAYYENAHTARYLRREQPVKTDQTVALADTILNDVFVIQHVRGRVPWLDNGHRDWYYKGPNNDREWAWLSNRHSQIDFVLTAYFETGNPKYARYIDLFLRDFIISSMPYPGVKGSGSIWRGLEVSFRAKVWSRVFFGLINSEYLSPATRILILSSLPDHAHYNRHFHGGNNWLTMELSALATVATNFPEYKASGEWLAYSIRTMTASMGDQVYADGVQTELTSHYHNVALRNFELFRDICSEAGKPLPDPFNRTIEDMYGYIAHAVRPDGCRPLNNDGDRGSDRDLILEGSEKFGQTEWAYIITNGRSGSVPQDGPSYFYPWAGQLLSRSGFDADAHWSFFDIGPWGSGHQHNDKLHISIAAYGRDLLVDAGRFAYTGDVARKFRPYARSSDGHNLILIDHRGQDRGPTHAREPLGSRHFNITDDFDYASSSFGSFHDMDGKAEHIRAVFYVRGEYWVVVDRIITDRPREIDAMWHWHPDCIVEQAGQVVRTRNKKGNLAVIPVGDQRFDIRLVKGQEEPHIQGWYSPEYNIYEPNVTSSYSTVIHGNTTFVWLLLPSEKKMPEHGAGIISEDEGGVEVAVKIKKQHWQLVIPYVDSRGAKLSGP
jgi:hypothetical protein